jgi:hypothetical protein
LTRASGMGTTLGDMRALCLASLAVLAACSGAGGADPFQLSSTDRPSKRSDVEGVADPITGEIVIFGGDDGPIVNQRPTARFRDDTWLFEPGFGWRELDVAGPSARSRYAVTYDEGRMLLFGGRFRAGTSGDYVLNNDLWAFDFATRSWTLLAEGTLAGPPPRFDGALAVDVEGNVHLIGGGLNVNALAPQPAQDWWTWDGSRWRERTAIGQPPTFRLFETFLHDTTRDLIVVFGGQVGDFFSPSLRQLYTLRLSDGQWSQLDVGTGPSGRFNGMGAYDAARDRYLIFGGHPDPGTANDLWAWDAVRGGWTELEAGDRFTGGPLGCLGNPSEIPPGYVEQDLSSPERRQGGVFQVVGDRAWLVAGEGDCSDHLDDMWAYDLAGDEGWREVLEARTGESCDRQNDDCQCLCL